MSACNFDIPFNGPVSVAIEKAKAAIESQNGTFNGNDTSGEFGVTILGNTIKGSYTITGQVLHLTITQKPLFVPCSMIESFLLKQVS
jgi:hypothetical protein